MPGDSLAAQIASLRRFNRYYTQKLGALGETLLDDRHNLTQSRILWELANAPSPLTAAALAATLELDPGYLSRTLRRLDQEGLVSARKSAKDGRERLLTLSAGGRKAFARMDAASRRQLASWLAPLTPQARAQVVAGVAAAQRALQGRRADITLRAHRPGDIGWVISAHGAMYAAEFGWDISFEALVARIAAQFIERFDPQSEACWIAERDGQRIGSVFLVRKSRTVAQLRLLLIDPDARGHGLGKRLVAECERFARERGYRKIMLWTNDCLHAARAIYVAAGYRLLRSEPHHSFGHDLVGQIWELKL